MEFPNVGERCSWALCKTLDFLPFTCSYCNQIFCKDHFNQESHKCQFFKKEISKQNDIKSFVCSIKDCNTCNPVEMVCPKCAKHFCLIHRYHDCFDTNEDIEQKRKIENESKEQFSESIKNVNCTISEKIKKAVQNPKKQATALKIQLMRLKGKAEGNSGVPTDDRIYFLIILPKSCSKPSKAVFISKDWSVGKVIDAVSSLCHVVNKNNETNSPKLRLFKATDGSQISTETSLKILDLINSNIITNGESLILEYVDPKEDIKSFILKDFLQYESA